MIVSVTDDNCDELCPKCGDILSKDNLVCGCDMEGIFYIPKNERDNWMRR